jgi:hypothetical protein
VSTLAERKALTAQRQEEHRRLIDRILELDAQGVPRGKIAAEVGRSPQMVSNTLCSFGRRKRVNGVRNPQLRRYEEVACESCGSPFKRRSDHKSRLCLACRPRFEPGHVPANKGSTDGQVTRRCEQCREFFTVNRGYLDRKSGPKYRYGSFCSRACYGLAQRTPGSRYSAFR